MKRDILTKIVIAIVAVSFLIPSVSLAQNITEKKQAAAVEMTYGIPYTITFSENDLSYQKQNGYDIIQMNDVGFLSQPGKPLLPMKTIQIALPAGMKATNIQILNVQEQPITGTYTIFPAQPPQTLDTPRTTVPFVKPDANIYQSGVEFPLKVVELTGETDLAGQPMAEIIVYPVHYLPDQKQVTLTTSIEFIVTGVDGYVCGDYLSSHISASGQAMYTDLVKEIVANPQDVHLHSSNIPQPMGVPSGAYSYVIITQSSWVNAFQPLADWKTKKGVPATIVTTEWIYATYSGSTPVDKIRAFVQDAYTNWGAIFFLLGGDTDYIPFKYTTFSSVDPDPVPNDTYYADFDSDWIIEVNVGRASVTTTGAGANGIGNFINKVLTYEKNPPSTNYLKKAAMFGFDLDSVTYAEQCKSTIASSYLSGWTVTMVYDSQIGNHKTNVIAAMNAGQNLINHADHSNADSMGVGYINHGWLLEDSDIDALTNGNKQSIFYSMGCDPCSYDDATCIAEHFVRNVNGGGVAFIGNSRYGWYNSGMYSTLSMGYDQKFFYSLITQNNYKLGATFSAHKNDYPPGNDAYLRYIWTELTLLGDPELPVWTTNPVNLTVTYPSQLPVGSSSFTVHVIANGSPLNQAYVCLWKGTDVYLTGYTNSLGDVIFTPSPSTTGTMYVTVTKHNYLPSEGSATIISPQYTLMVYIDPVNSGTVTKNPDQTTYTYGQNVQLTANANPGWLFDHWSNNASGNNNPITITIDGNKIVTANFIQPQPPAPMQVVDITSWHTWTQDLYKGIGGYPGKYTGQPYTYQSTSTESGSDLYFTFSWGDTTNTIVGPVSGSASATHTYAIYGTYSITATVKHGTDGLPSNPSAVRTVNMYKAGDMNLDGGVSWRDIDLLVSAMGDNKAAYYAAVPNGYIYAGDCNFDQHISWRDIDPFVALMST